MPDKRKHRGPHPQDSFLFSEEHLPVLRAGVADFSWLLSRDYPEKGALKLVGDRYRLKRRQRMAISRCAGTFDAVRERRRRECSIADVSGKPLHIDGFNLLITVESALSGGFLFEGADGCYRDLASVHGSYKRVMETERSVKIIGESLVRLGAAHTHWLLDQPVSNSGRLRRLLYETAAAEGWKWDVFLSADPDQVLANSDAVVVSADSFIIDQAGQWFNMVRYLVDRFIPDARLISLAPVENNN